MVAVNRRLEENPRTAKKAAIRRASAAARNDLRRLDRATAAELQRLYEAAGRDLQAAILAHAGQDGTVRIEAMQDLLTQVDARISQLSDVRGALLDDTLAQAAAIGTQPWQQAAGDLNLPLTQVADDALRFVTTFVADDGLQLSDRIWRIDNGAREIVTRSIQSAVIQGHSASQAASEFLAKGLAVPRDVGDKQAMANGARIARDVWSGIMNAEGNPRANAMRVFRTELNRAHGEAYQGAAFAHPDVVGTRFELSPRHPQTDICDLHANVNRYGLGKGVYPKGRNPWPAHPNTLSFVEPVFADEVTDADRAGKQDRIDWLKGQPPGIQAQVLGGYRKALALRRGILRENEIATPWRVLKERYKRRGLDPDSWSTPPPPPPAQPPRPTGVDVPKDNPQAERWSSAFDRTDPAVLDVVRQYPAPEVRPPSSGYGAYHQNGGIAMGPNLDPATPNGRRAWRHEYGHYLDYQLRQPGQYYASDSPEGRAAIQADADLWLSRQKQAYKNMKAGSPAAASAVEGRRFSQAAYKTARARVEEDVSDALRAEAKPGQSPADLARERLDADDSIYGTLWRLIPKESQLPIDYYAAREFDDLAFFADGVGSTHESYVNISDLVGSITLNKVGYGHSTGYYKAWSHRQAAEAVANTFDLLTYGAGTPEADILEAFAPNTAAYTREILGL